MSTLDRWQSFVALDNLVADIALVLDSWKLRQGTIVTVLHFLSTIQILDVSRVLQVGTRSRMLVLIERKGEV